MPRPAPRARSLGIQEGTATLPDAARPGAGRSRGPRAVHASRLCRPHPGSASPAPCFLLRPRTLRRAPALRPLPPPSATRHRRTALTSSRAHGAEQQDPQQCDCGPAGLAGHGSGAPRPRRGKRLWPVARSGGRGRLSLAPAPPRLAHLRAGGPGLRPARGSTSWAGLSPPLSPPPPRPAAAARLSLPGCRDLLPLSGASLSSQGRECSSLCAYRRKGRLWRSRSAFLSLSRRQGGPCEPCFARESYLCVTQALVSRGLAPLLPALGSQDFKAGPPFLFAELRVCSLGLFTCTGSNARSTPVLVAHEADC